MDVVHFSGRRKIMAVSGLLSSSSTLKISRKKKPQPFRKIKKVFLLFRRITLDGKTTADEIGTNQRKLHYFLKFTLVTE